VTARGYLIILLLILLYLGPYLFVYARTATWTFPRIDERDIKAFDEIQPYINPTANLTKVYSIDGASEANYSLNTGLFNRKFLDWIGFPLVLEVKNFTLKASGISQGKVIFHCNYMEADFPKPGPSQPWYIYQTLVDKYDNSTRNIPCYGDASLIENNATTPLSLNSTMSEQNTTTPLLMLLNSNSTMSEQNTTTPLLLNSTISEQNTTTPLLLNWTMSGKLVGDKNDRIRTWTNSQSLEIADVRQ
jgi:hypothetical protein